METHQLLVQIAVILLAARLCAEVANWLKIPTIIGELSAGIILGPSLLGFITPNNVIELLAEIGIILLLFEVGLETEINRLVKAGPRAAIVALVGFILPLVLGFTVSHILFELSVLVSLFIGGTLTATSIGITVRILSDLGRHNKTEGQIVLGAAVIDDLLGVFLLAVLYEFSHSNKIDIVNLSSIILYVTAFFFLAPIAAKLLSPIIKRYSETSAIPGLIPIILVSLVLLFAAMAHSVGAPHLLGGFVAGVALSRRFFLPLGALIAPDITFTDKIQQQMKPIIQLFTPIFFVMVGLSLDLSVVDWTSSFIWLFSLSILAVAILSKMVGPWLISESLHNRIAIGMAMVPRGEVGLIFAELGRAAGIFEPDIYAGLVLVIAYTTIASPIWIKLYYKRYHHIINGTTQNLSTK